MKEEPRFLPLLVHIIGMQDAYGVHHSDSVTRLALALAKEAGIQDASVEMDDLELASMLHDIGKLGIPESIRRLPGKYTNVEREVMKSHSTIGEALLRLVPNGGISEEVRRIIRHHHEDWDGGGYPDGLSGEAIPVGARIVRICDTYDAITQERGYQSALSPKAALEDMFAAQVVRQWADPVLLDVFSKLIMEGLI